MVCTPGREPIRSIAFDYIVAPDLSRPGGRHGEEFIVVVGRGLEGATCRMAGGAGYAWTTTRSSRATCMS